MSACGWVGGWVYCTCSGAEIEHSLRILNGSHGQFAAGEHEVYVVGEVHTGLLVVVVWLVLLVSML